MLFLETFFRMYKIVVTLANSSTLDCNSIFSNNSCTSLTSYENPFRPVYWILEGNWICHIKQEEWTQMQTTSDARIFRRLWCEKQWFMPKSLRAHSPHHHLHSQCYLQLTDWDWVGRCFAAAFFFKGAVRHKMSGQDERVVMEIRCQKNCSAALPAPSNEHADDINSK